MILFEKEYSAESLIDVSQDIADALDENYNLALSTIPKDQYQFHQGKFKITIEWSIE